MTRLCASLLLALLLWSAPALAHKVNIFATVDNGRIVGEGYYSGGVKARNVPVEVLDASGSLVGQTTTDEAGGFSLPVPAGATPPLRLVLKAGEGHQNDYPLSAADLGPVPPGAPSAHGPTAGTTTPPAKSTPDSLVSPAVNQATLEAALGRVLDARLAPLRQHLLRLEERGAAVTARDVVGGLGWIVGLAGLAYGLRRSRG